MGTSLDTGNRGVLALAASLVKIVNEVVPESEISFFVGSKRAKPFSFTAGGKKIDVDTYNFRLSPTAAPSENIVWLFVATLLFKIFPVGATRRFILEKNPPLKMLSRTDFIGDIRGGDSFSDIYGLKRFLTGSLPDLICLLLSKNLVMLPQTYGPFSSVMSRVISGTILRKSHRVLARDTESLEVALRAIGNRGSEPILCPDVAFLLDAIPPDPKFIEEVFMSNDGQKPATLIGINVNGLMYNGGYTRDNMFGLELDYREFLVLLIENFLKTTNANILLVPHTYGLKGTINSDPDAATDVYSRIPSEFHDSVFLITQEYDQSEIKGIIGLCDFFIGSRMHACIAALSQGIPSLALAYSRKFRGVFESIGAGHMVIDARETTTQKAVKDTIAFYIRRVEEGKSTRENLVQVQSLIRRIFKDLLGEVSHAGLFIQSPEQDTD